MRTFFFALILVVAPFDLEALLAEGEELRLGAA
jgi:hypothetical protein